MKLVETSRRAAVRNSQGECSHPVTVGNLSIRCGATSFLKCPSCSDRLRKDRISVLSDGYRWFNPDTCMSLTIPAAAWAHSLKGAVTWNEAASRLRSNIFRRLRRWSGKREGKVEIFWSPEAYASGATHFHLLLRFSFVLNPEDADTVRSLVSGTRTRSKVTGLLVRVPELSRDAVKCFDSMWDVQAWASYISKDFGLPVAAVIGHRRAAALSATASSLGLSVRLSRRFGYSGRSWGCSRGWSRQGMTLRSIRQGRMRQFFPEE